MSEGGFRADECNGGQQNSRKLYLLTGICYISAVCLCWVENFFMDI